MALSTSLQEGGSLGEQDGIRPNHNPNHNPNPNPNWMEERDGIREAGQACRAAWLLAQDAYVSRQEAMKHKAGRFEKYRAAMEAECAAVL